MEGLTRFSDSHCTYYGAKPQPRWSDQTNNTLSDYINSNRGLYECLQNKTPVEEIESFQAEVGALCHPPGAMEREWLVPSDRSP